MNDDWTIEIFNRYVLPSYGVHFGVNNSFLQRMLHRLGKNYINIGVIHFRWNLFHSAELGQREILIVYMNKRLPLWWHKTKILFHWQQKVQLPFTVISMSDSELLPTPNTNIIKQTKG